MREIRIFERDDIDRAVGRMRNGCIQVQVPKRWSQRHKASVAEELARKVKEREEERRRILQEIDLSQSPRVTIETNEALQALVDEINAQTFRIDGVRAEIGSSRYTRLAQMNIRTRVMRVSRFSLRNVPSKACGICWYMSWRIVWKPIITNASGSMWSALYPIMSARAVLFGLFTRSRWRMKSACILRRRPRNASPGPYPRLPPRKNGRGCRITSKLMPPGMS